MKCTACGADTPSEKRFCEYCGTEFPKPQEIITNNTTIQNIYIDSRPQRQRASKPKVSSKSKGMAIFLCCLSFIGLGGLNRFYVGKKVSGILYFFTFGLCLVGAIVDLVMLKKNVFTDSRGLPLK